MIIQANHVFGAVAYNLTKAEGAGNYAKLDDAAKARYGALSPFFLGYIGGGDISRHNAEAVGAALQKHSPDIIATAAQARFERATRSGPR